MLVGPKNERGEVIGVDEGVTVVELLPESEGVKLGGEAKLFRNVSDSKFISNCPKESEFDGSVSPGP